MSGNAKQPYGDVHYADPGYQSDGTKRYPIDTEEHVRAAWSYINQAHNASKYSSEHLAEIKSRIRAAGKKFGIQFEGESKAKDESEVNGAIECRAAVAISPTATNEIVFLPVGLHAITPVKGGIGRPIKVLVDRTAGAAMEAQRSAISARTGKRVYFDFNHEDGPASFWPQSFSWRDGEGVIAHGEWSASGRRAVEGKDFRAFSPVFHVDDKRGNPSRVICVDEAAPNMGGLVNDPAFSDLPLWAKNHVKPDGSGHHVVNAGATSDAEKQQKKESIMTTEEIAELRAKNEELQKEVRNLTAEVENDEADQVKKSRLEAATEQMRANELELTAAELRADNERQSAIIRKRNAADAEAAVKDAVARGAILPKDLRTQDDLRAKATADPSFITVIKAMVGKGKQLGERITSSSSQPIASSSGSRVGYGMNEDPARVYGELHRLVSIQARSSMQDQKREAAKEFGLVYAREFQGDQGNRLLSCSLANFADAIMAGDVTDANLGTLAGTLVSQRVLELLRLIFPMLNRFTTDFSDQPATFNQTIMTRIVTIPNVQTYSTTSGWTDSTAQTTDVPVLLNQHKGVPITFNENILASTMRRLFDEFAPAAAYALAKNIVDTLYGNLTDANFTNNTIVASTAFVRSNIVDIGVALDQRGVPLGLGQRTMVLWPAAFGNLLKDPVVVNFATYQTPRVVTDSVGPDSAFVIPLESFQIFSAPNMPSNNANLVGFAGSKSALCVVGRVPNDYTSVLPGASFGNVQIVTDPNTGFSVMQVQYVNHVLGTATSRIATMFGTAAGQTAAGQLIKAAAGTGSAR